MTQTHTAHYGPRLVAHPTGALRAAVIVRPGPAIENAQPLHGELNAIHSRAVAEQQILAKTLRYFGCEVTVLDQSGSDPYACAVVDAAVVFENGAVIMRPGSLTRRPESAWLEGEFVQRDIPIAGHIAAPGLLNGSDVLLVGNTAFIGTSKRSNALGRNGFAQIAKAHGFSVREVQLRDPAAPLRALAGALSSDTVVLGPENSIDHAPFEGFKIFTAPLGHERGAGVLNLGDHHVLADVRYPSVIDMLRRGGIVVEAIDLHDFGRVGISPSMLVLDLKRV
jgi:dimethylargininase